MSMTERLREYLSDDVRRLGVQLAVVMGVACLCYLVAIFLLGIEGEVMEDRYWKNVQPLFRGTFPVMEYPPFSLVFMLMPRIFFADPFWYNVGYVIEVYVFMVLGMVITAKLAESYGRHPRRYMIAYAAMMVLMLEFVTDRFDIFPAVISMAAVWMFLEKRYDWAFLLVAVGTMTKVYPVILFPVMFLMLVMSGDHRGAARGTVVFGLTSVALVLVALAMEPESVTSYLSYHVDRPLQVESVAASLIYPLSMAGLSEMHITSAEDPGSFGSDNLVGSIPDLFAQYAMPFMVASILLMYLAFLLIGLRRREGRETDLLFASTLLMVILLFIIDGKVFSSQYLIWTIPFILMVMMASDRVFGRRILAMTLMAMALTQANFAYNIGYLGGGPNINDLGMMLILVRNLVVVAMAVYVLWGIREVHRGHGPVRGVDDGHSEGPGLTCDDASPGNSLRNDAEPCFGVKYDLFLLRVHASRFDTQIHHHSGSIGAGCDVSAHRWHVLGHRR